MHACVCVHATMYARMHTPTTSSCVIARMRHPIIDATIRQVLVYALLASSMLAAMLGSSMSTFGVETCNGSSTLGPLLPVDAGSSHTEPITPAGYSTTTPPPSPSGAHAAAVANTNRLPLPPQTTPTPVGFGGLLGGFSMAQVTCLYLSLTSWAWARA